MSDLITSSPEALAWIDSLKIAHANDRRFGSLGSGVGWLNEPGPDGIPIGGEDPSAYIDEINQRGLPLLRDHDPGKPMGRVIAAKLFVHPNGVVFVAIFIGIYSGGETLSFAGLGIDPNLAADPLTLIDVAPQDWWIGIGSDPREFDEAWISALTADTPLRVKRSELSHNAEEALLQILNVALPYMVLVWNPMVTAIGENAGKEIYEGTRTWLRRLWDHLKDRKNPVVALTSHHFGCAVRFLVRGSDVSKNYAAHDALPNAAASAGKLLDAMRRAGVTPSNAVYEFEVATGWYPSYVELDDGRIVSDRNVLIALERSNLELSLGVRVLRGANKPDKR